MQSAKAEFDRRSVSIIVVSFAEPSTLVRYQEIHRSPFTILSDPERAAYRTLALERLAWWRVFSPKTLKLYVRLFRQGMKSEDYGKQDIYQSGGDFLLDRGGSILFAHRSHEPADRPTVNKLLHEIDNARPSAESREHSISEKS